MLVLLLNLVNSANFTNVPSTGLGMQAYDHKVVYASKTNELIIYGGTDENKNKINKIWCFSLDSLFFSEKPQISSYVPLGRSGHCGFYNKAKHQMIIIGGETVLGLSNEVITYDLSVYSWKLDGEMPKPLRRMGCIEDSAAKIGYIYGGIGLHAYSSDLYTLNLTSLQFQTIPTAGSGPVGYKYVYLALTPDTLYTWVGSNQKTVSTSLYTLSLKNYTWSAAASTNPNMPRATSMNNIAIINQNLYIFPGYPYSNTTYLLNLLNNTWSSITNGLLSGRLSYTASVVNNFVYIYGGFSKSTTFNDLIRISEDYEVVSEYTPAVSPRIDCLFSTLLQDFIVFGGESYDGNKLNEFWRYDTQNRIWVDPHDTGIFIPQTSGMGYFSLGYSLYVFGGESNSGLTNNLDQLDMLNYVWNRISPVTQTPSNRKYPCVCGYSQFIYIYGGITELGWNDELWVYNIKSFSYTLLSQNSLLGPGKVRVYSCIVNTIEDNLTIIFPSIRDQLGIVSFYDIKTNGWKVPVSVTGVPVLLTIFYLIQIKNQEYLLIGYEYREKISSLHVANATISYSKITISYLTYFEYFSIDSAILILGNQLVEFGGILAKMYSATDTIPINILFNFTGLGLDLCSAGYYLNKSCIPCPAGYYSSFLYGDKCLPCPPGTFNPYVGASSVLMCLNCQYGTYSLEEGSSVCLECPSSYYCPVGSSAPQISLDTVSSDASIQPYYQLGNPLLISQISFYAIILVILINLARLITFLLFPNLKKNIKRFDLFKNSHKSINGHDMKIKKTIVGGFFSMIAYTICLYLIITASSSFILSNVSETKTEVPFAIQDNVDVTGNIRIEVFLKDYKGNCTDYYGDCVGGINITQSLYNYQKLDIVCEKLTTGCKIYIICTGCEFFFSSSIVFVLSEVKSYTSQINVNITSDSSIPGYTSSVNSIIVPAETNSMLCGVNPSVFYYSITRSIFTYNSDTSTGFHIVNAKPNEKGSEIDYQEVFSAGSLSLIIDIQVSDNILVTQRTDNTSIFTFLLTAVSTCLGALSLSKFAMHLFEFPYENYKFKIKNLKKLKSISEKSEKIRKIIKDKQLVKIASHTNSSLLKEKDEVSLLVGLNSLNSLSRN